MSRFCILELLLTITCLHETQSRSELGLSQDSAAKKEDKMLFLNKFVWDERGDSIFWHENFVCNSASAKQLVQLCAGALLEIRRPSKEKFVGVKHELLDYEANTNTKCARRNIHFLNVKHRPFTDVPMFKCKFDRIFYKKPENVTSKFYIMSGKDRSVLFVLLDIGFDKEGVRLKDGVKVWHRIVLF